MINVEAIAKALMIPDATVTSVAQTIGALGDTCGDCYLVKSNDSRLRDVEIGVKDQKNDPNVAPTYVQLYFAPGQAVSLAETAPFCKHWRWMPNGVHSTPNFYACDYEKSPQVWVTLFAELSGDIDAPSSHLDGLLLQRNLL